MVENLKRISEIESKNQNILPVEIDFMELQESYNFIFYFD